MKMFEPQRLHPLAALTSFLKALKDNLFTIILLVVLGSRNGGNYLLFFLLGTILLALLSGITKWFCFRFWLEEDQLCITSGLFVKKERFIPFERIQNINRIEGVIHRPFKLAKLEIETAGSMAELAGTALEAIKKSDADTIIHLISEQKRRYQTRNEEYEQGICEQKQPLETATTPEPALHAVPETQTLYVMSIKELFIFGATAGGVFVLLLSMGAILPQIQEAISIDFLLHWLEGWSQFSPLLIAFIILIIMLGTWIFSILLTMARYHRFTVTRSADELILTRGLFERKQVTIPLQRIQGILLVASPLRQLLGYTTLKVVSAGGQLGAEREANTLLFPLLKTSMAKQRLQTVLPDYQLATALSPLPARARGRYLRRPIYPVLPLSAAVSYWGYPWGLLSLILIPLGMLWGHYQYRSAGFLREDEMFTLRWRSLSQKTLLTPKKRIQALAISQNPFQQRKELRTIYLSLKSGASSLTGKLRDLDRLDAERLYTWYSYQRPEETD